MMRLLSRFIDFEEQAVSEEVEVERIGAPPVVRRLQRMGEEIAESQLEGFENLSHQLEDVNMENRLEEMDQEEAIRNRFAVALAS